MRGLKQGAFLPEVQGLRAIAVVSVLIFHIWPSVLTGGYVGVDVFFVISGYLITGLLLREAQQSGSVSLLGFYSKRIRRLLPAATLVILVVAIFVIFLPQVQWSDTAKEILASTFYVQNWWLASQAVDYLAEDNAVGLLRHYWSLSVEEQYYIVWPLIFLFITSIFKAARHRPRFVFGVVISLIAALSLAYSIYLTEKNPGLAYFATTTRAWELAIGGLLAVGLQNRNGLAHIWSTLLGWIGLFAIVLACILFDERTAFPGYAALLPTIGAALIIAAGRSEQWWSSYRFLASKSMQYLGDISYSLYLWHWPIVVLYGLYIGGDMNLADGVFVFTLSLVLAHFTKIYVEDLFRRKGSTGFGVFNQSFSMGAFSFALTLLAANYVWLLSDTISGSSSAVVNSSDIGKMLTQKYDPSLTTYPSLLDARKDNPDVYRLKCHVNQISSEPSKCEFGEPSARYHVVLVGDSHAAQWLPSLQGVLEKNKSWRISTYTKSACAFNAAVVSLGKDRKEYTSCTEWNNNVMGELKKIRPDVVVTSQSSGHRALGASDLEISQKILAEGLLQRWQELDSLGTKVMVVRDTPWMDQNPVECMSKANASLSKCSTTRVRAFKRDSIMLAMQSKPNVTFLDLSNKICDKEWCMPIQGQILMWRDRHHLTATYARALSQEFRGILKLVD